ncbi:MULTISPECIES: ROK family transcriptional regulator [Bacillaceae]|uniref:ROK family transcriptional regulator n=1 Tax=Bacillaceae TaxID=186817 RepID=UPI000BA2CC05|nr:MULTISPECIES: ROK family transcriptional regulator [Bacillaceae]AWI11216.1 ROK family transcriptional regulator [Caldibacillus thermoamylovorans]MBU5343247.1 ROK family protein [Caldifermentibacillus hisashii]MCB7070709.1 ROK family protein [Caldibacillus sp. 210928-DFI.2.22]MCB7074232.1 ROK family protein [Caldibacillus sp. 210928-DFI.2.18]PAC33873.1 ROK family protein [Caldifermentibacillus hisashii]
MKTLTGNQQLVKQINKTLVLETILHEAPISRADISQKVGLNKGTVSSLVNELLEDQLIYESGPGQSSGGRRPVILLFNDKAGFSIGIDLGVNYILGVLTDLRGNIIVEVNKKLTVRSYEVVIEILQSVISDLINAAPQSHYGIVGIGIGVPGLVNNHGEVLVAPNLGWKNINLREEIENCFDIPVVIENEANAGAYGEKLYGAGKENDNILYISAGIGIGIGIILNGELFYGMNGFSGEAGHMIVQVNGKDCTCGSSGCWELYASEKALLEEARKLKLTDITEETLSIELLLELANSGNEDIINLFHSIGMYLGVGINNIINIFNPEQVIIGNRLAMAKDWLEKSIEKFIKNHTMKYHQKDLIISFSKHAYYSAAIGVSAQMIDQFLNNAVSILDTQ